MESVWDDLLGNNRHVIFVAEEDDRFFRNAMVKAAANYGLAIHAYVWMSNHIQLLASPGSGSAISKVFQSMGGGDMCSISMPATDAAAPRGRGVIGQRWWTASTIC